MKIAVIGSTMMDVVAYTDAMPAPGETRAMQDFHVACGGKGANQAVAAAKCGAEVLMVTKTGDDIFHGVPNSHAGRFPYRLYRSRATRYLYRKAQRSR